MKRTNEEATETGSDSEGGYSDADQQGSCSTQKGTKKRKVGGNDATKHALGYKTKWESEFPWLLPEKNSTGTETGMLCRSCKRHKTGNKYNKATVWSDTPCVCLRKDSIRRHSQSLQHKEAVEKELARERSSRDGGIEQAFQTQI